jgi:hypothetical protein
MALEDAREQQTPSDHSIFPKKLMMRSSPAGNAKPLRKHYPCIFRTTIHLSPSLYKFHNSQVPQYNRAHPALSRHSWATGIMVHRSKLDCGLGVDESRICFLFKKV